jgi:hypothetical protein
MEESISGSNEKEDDAGMSPQSEFLDLICTAAENNCNLDTKISTKELPPEGGLYAELGEGFGDGQYYSKGASEKTIPVLFLCRNVSQERCLDQLADICNYLSNIKEYPNGQQVAWMNAITAKEPNKIGRDEDGKYYYSAIVNCKVYF